LGSEQAGGKESWPRPFLKWPGGKRQLLPELLWAIRGAGSFRRYHEPFLGGGALFFGLARSGALDKSGASLSDINPNLIDAYVGVRDDVAGVIKRLKGHRANHDEAYFYKVRASSPGTLSARAARIIYLNKTCFNGLYRENSKGLFNVPFGQYKNPQICDEENLKAVSDVLGQTGLGVQSFAAIGDTAERGDLVYFDPPYVPLSKTAQFTSYAAGGFRMAEQEQLAHPCVSLAERGVKVILSNSLTGITRSLYEGFDIYRVNATRRINVRADRRGAVGEALVTSFRIEGASKRPTHQKAMLVSGCARGIERMEVKQWLSENGYTDVAKLIDEVTSEWKAQGKQTRRNWWEVLAGGSNGKARVVAGRAFPVLWAAQSRQGLPVTDNALHRGSHEGPPVARIGGRWGAAKTESTEATDG
jgi:DNA adenine methylase